MSIVFFLLVLSFTTIYTQITKIIGSETYRAVSSSQSLYRVKVGKTRGFIYDRYFRPIVNCRYENTLSVIPSPEVLPLLKSELSDEEFKAILPSLESGRPTKFITNAELDNKDGLSVYSFPIRYSENQIAPHIVGYMNNENKGIYGIEKGYDKFLRDMGGEVSLTYRVNAYGGALGSTIEKIRDTRYSELSQGGVVLTLDRDIQSITENAMRNIEKGAAVVMDVKTGEILGIVSKPSFNPSDVASAINSSDSPLFNRAIASYSVGSTFKTVVAAAALERGFSTEHKEVCSGKYTLNDVDYHCHKLSGHWEIDMWEAMAHSCNVYFIELGNKLPYSDIINMARRLGFDTRISLAEGVVCDKGSLPELETITRGEYCNLCFGQGLLTATPVQITAMMSTVANGGIKVNPTLYRGLTDDGYAMFKKAEVYPKERIFSRETAETLNELLTYVVTDGSGKNAQSRFCSCAGKTGSAQTGKYINEEEIVEGWFAGFFPSESPRYAVAVLEEGGGNGAKNPSYAFKEIADNICLLEDKNIRSRYFN